MINFFGANELIADICFNNLAFKKMLSCLILSFLKGKYIGE